MITDASPESGFSSDLEAALLEDLRASSAQTHNGRVDLAVRDDDGALLAGLAATTSYGWLRVNMLWVCSGHRRTGLGRQLMQRAFEQSLQKGCHATWLETSNPQARDFYKSLEFEVFAALTNEANDVPQGHTRWFLRRKLGPSLFGETS
ncbi:GNAT family N-acetyltransferase [Octadecabacter temperatus]|uniref:GNAT family N-acetyltransferase n=1 Tax=Octadecabacter temperatus TaxID=1458307 RepID=UPI000941006F|nr:GNAT family N-acetyltransferase [Octadecabacter temperatus]